MKYSQITKGGKAEFALRLQENPNWYLLLDWDGEKMREEMSIVSDWATRFDQVSVDALLAKEPYSSKYEAVKLVA